MCGHARVPCRQKSKWAIPPNFAAPRRVVVTGMGITSPLGVGVDHVWSRVCNGDSGITRLDDPAFEKIPARVAGMVPRGPRYAACAVLLVPPTPTPPDPRPAPSPTCASVRKKYSCACPNRGACTYRGFAALTHRPRRLLAWSCLALLGRDTGAVVSLRPWSGWTSRLHEHCPQEFSSGYAQQSKPLKTLSGLQRCVTLDTC